MASTLQRLAEKGAREFYEGDLAADIVADVQAAGGCLSLEDMKSYQAVLSDPLATSYRGGTVYTPPSMTAGRTFLNVLAFFLGRALMGRHPVRMPIMHMSTHSRRPMSAGCAKWATLMTVVRLHAQHISVWSTGTAIWLR